MYYPSTFMPFNLEHYDRVGHLRKLVMQQLEVKVDKSSLKSNAENRLLSELQKIYILTNSLGWKLEYKKTEILNQEALKGIFNPINAPD